MEDEKRNESEIHTDDKPKKKTDPVVVGLMFAVSFLCLCITGVMIYWLTAFLS